MIITSNSIEVLRTTLFDCRKILYFNIIIGGFLSVLFAVISHLYLGCLIVFIMVALLDPGFYINLRTPYRFEFKNGYVNVYFRFYGKRKVEAIPYECFVFVKKNGTKKVIKHIVSIIGTTERKIIIPFVCQLCHR